MAQENFDKEHVGTSKFYMLRCLVAMAHADGIICEAEQAYISALMSRLPLTDDQRKTLYDDLDTPQKIEDLLPYINAPKFRGQLCYFARLMAYKDGVLSPSEEQLLEKMHAYATDGLDMEAIRQDVQTAVSAEMTMHDIEIDQNRPKRGKHFIPYFQWLDEVLLNLGIDLMKD
tara:strand:- start:745 stop:1263 length:519 start_codon:yes stop_codon:yes gene_type:complete